jgi:hypothetical protein
LTGTKDQLPINTKNYFYNSAGCTLGHNVKINVKELLRLRGLTSGFFGFLSPTIAFCSQQLLAWYPLAAVDGLKQWAHC